MSKIFGHNDNCKKKTLDKHLFQEMSRHFERQTSGGDGRVHVEQPSAGENNVDDWKELVRTMFLEKTLTSENN